MITPRFSLDQNETHLIIKIRAPHCSLKELEIYVEGSDFRFVCNPYYLRLNLPGNILDNDLSSGKFDSDNGTFEFKYEKENKNEYFDGLNFITSLLAPKKAKVEPRIEVLGSEDTAEEEEWYVEQKDPNIEDTTLLNGFKYGFANKKSETLRDTEAIYRSVYDILNPDTTSLTDRKLQKYDSESMHFSEEHYLADFFEDEEIKSLIAQPLPWKADLAIFSPQDIDTLKDFPNKEYLLSENEKKIVFLGLVDILYAYCYDQRTTNFEGNCESGWTFTKLSGTLSWFHVFADETEVIKSCFRRSMVYPLYRNFELSKKIFQDLKYLLTLGEVFIVKCLIEIFHHFNTSADPRYILNDLYIKDYIIYMQKCDKELWKLVIDNVKKVEIQEEELDLNYHKLKIIKDGGQHAILERLANLNIANSSDSDDTESDSDTDSDYTSEDSDDSSDTS